MGFQLKHIQATANGKRYRRRIPKDVKESLNGQESFIRPLGSSHDEVLSNYSKAHAEFERLVKTARTKQSHQKLNEQTQRTELDDFKEVEQRIRAKGYSPQLGSYDIDDPNDRNELEARSYEADRVLAEYPIDASDGNPMDVSTADLAFVRAISSGTPQQPQPTLQDAKHRYLEDKGYNDPAEIKNKQRINAVVEHVQNALKRDPIITTIKRQEAREVLRYMEKDLDIAGATVNRYLNDVRAIVSYGLVEFDCDNIENKFKGLSAAKSGLAKDSRRPFTNEELDKITDRIDTKANEQLKNIWGILSGTGCRLSEVVGLRISDVFLDVEIPYIRVEGHEGRRLKTEASSRWVPLVGDTLEIAKDAFKKTAGAPMLFSRYGNSKSGATSVSAALMKHVRCITVDEKAVVHSLRHNMKDWLKEAGASKQVQDEILGHTSGGISESYGGNEAKLRIATEWLSKAITEQSQVK